MLRHLYVLKVAILHFVAGQLPHPNILFIMVDDLRPALGSYGDQLALTPSLDALSEAGVTFSSAFAQEALCGPSRTSLLTSRRPDSTRVVDAHHYWRDYHNFTTLPQHFKEHGYYTASAGKIFHPGRCSNYSDDSPYSWSAVPYHPSTQQYKNSPVCGLYRNMTNIVCPVQLEDQPEGTLPDLQTTHYAISFMQQWRDRQASSQPNRADCRGSRQNCGCSQPFFLAVGYHKPHIPLKFPRQFLDLFPLSSVPLAPDRHLPKGLPSVAYNPWNDLRWRDDIAALNLTFPYQPMPDHYSRLIKQAYYAATAYTDMLIGDLLSTAYLLHPETLVLVAGDHGWSLGEHQEWSKFSNYDIATRVPLITAPLFRYPAAKAALFADKRIPNYFRYKKYVKIQKKVLKNVEKWAGNNVRDLSAQSIIDQQTASDDVKSEILKSDYYMKKSLEFQELNHENSGKREKNFNVNRSNSKFQSSCNIELNLDEQQQHMRQQPRTLTQLLKQARRQDSNREMKENINSKIWRELKRNFTYAGIVELLDIFPTLADLAGISRVPSCGANIRAENFRTGFATDSIPRRVELSGPNRSQSLSKTKRRNKESSAHFVEGSECKSRVRNLRDMFFKKLLAAVRRTSKTSISTLEPRRNTPIADAVFTASNAQSNNKHLKKHTFDHRSKYSTFFETFFDENHQQKRSSSSPSSAPDTDRKRKKPRRTVGRKLSKTSFRADAEMHPNNEVRLCTEGQSLVPFIVEQPFVNSRFPKHSSGKRNFWKNEPNLSDSSVRKCADSLSTSFNLADGDAKTINRSMLSKQKSNIRNENLKPKSRIHSGKPQQKIDIHALRSKEKTSFQRCTDEDDVINLELNSEMPSPSALAHGNLSTLQKFPHRNSQNVTAPSKKDARDDLLKGFSSTPYGKKDLIFDWTESELCCIADASHGRLALSQYPRPSIHPSQHPDSDQPPLKDIRIMGYSFRSRCYRYTLWVAYNSSTQTPNFDEILAEELYDHRLDPREDKNLLFGSGNLV